MKPNYIKFENEKDLEDNNKNKLSLDILPRKHSDESKQSD